MISKIAKRLGGGACLFASLLVLAGCEEEVVEAPEVIRPVKAIKVADARSFERRWFSGRAKATQEIDLSFRVDGQLIERNVDVGTVVKKGDIVARLDPATYKAESQQARANLASAEATLRNAKDQLRRKRILVEKRVVSEAAVDRFLAAEREAHAAVVAQKAALQRRELDLSYTNLPAPFDGTIVRTFVENFQDVRAKQPVVRLVDSSRIEMVVDIPENLISQAHLVTEVLVVFDPFPDLEVSATIKEVGTEASQTTRTFPVTLIMDQPDGVEILPGMAGKARNDSQLNDTGGTQAVIVPDSAIFKPSDDEATYVWVIDEQAKTVARRKVALSKLTPRGYTVPEGLAPGEWVVTAGANHLREGQKVRFNETN